MQESIKNYSLYNDRMKRSLIDKLFWLNMIDNDVDRILDYGCADGSLLKQLQKLDSNLFIQGYDIDKNMVALCNENGVACTDDYSLLEKQDNSKTLLNLSSLIHEIYSYCDDAGVKTFWHRVFNGGFKYIAIRDMMVSNKCASSSTKPSDIRKVEKYIQRNRLETNYSEFTENFGSINHRQNFIHFLLKYTFTENWDREVKENYLPLMLEDFLTLLPNTYDILYLNHDIFPYKVQELKENMKLYFKEKTHIKVLLKRKEK